MMESRRRLRLCVGRIVAGGSASLADAGKLLSDEHIQNAFRAEARFQVDLRSTIGARFLDFAR